MITNPNAQPGTEVGCHYRWPYDGAHPDCWQHPHKGEILALDDPRAWAGSIAFSTMNPDQAAVTQHVESCLARNLLKSHVPVLWTWSFDGTQGVQWDSLESLRPYADELKAWEVAREEKWARCRKVA